MVILGGWVFRMSELPLEGSGKPHQQRRGAMATHRGGQLLMSEVPL